MAQTNWLFYQTIVRNLMILAFVSQSLTNSNVSLFPEFLNFSCLDSPKPLSNFLTQIQPKSSESCKYLRSPVASTFDNKPKI